MFRNREEAGRLLAQRLLHLKDRRPVVLALPRGGVPVGFEIALALGAPLDLLLVRKIGAPRQPELAVGAVVDGQAPETVFNEALVKTLAIPEDYLAGESKRQRAIIERRRQLYLRGRPRADVRNRAVIVVDDGIATGATVRVALRALWSAGAAWLVLAVPVAPAETLKMLRPEVDEIVILEAPEDFGAVGFHYADFRQVNDAEVIERLDHAPAASRSEPQATA